MIQSAGMVLRGGVRLLQPLLGDDATGDARALMSHVMGVEPGRLTLELSRMLTPQDVSRFEHLIKRRLAREPVSHLIGHRLFWGRRFQVTGNVLDPRPETEVLVAQALQKGAERVLDLGVGSGAILLTLLAEWPGAQGVGVDCSIDALGIAQANAAALGLADRVEFKEGSWFDLVEGQYDLIVSNPPYVTEAEFASLAPEVRDWEPTVALTPGGDGLEAYRQIAKDAAQHLNPGGRLLLEIGPDQAAAVMQLLSKAGFKDLDVTQDFDGRDRVISAQIAL
ncbi:MAG: peptide chain release factor N(5)-glutamine methyltransferase [Pseudomonadota bacterium]